MKTFSSCAPKIATLLTFGRCSSCWRDVVGALAQLLVAEAVGRQRVDRAVDVAELVVEERADDAGRQGGAHVADLLAHRVPDLRHLLRRRRVPHLKDDQRLARLGVAADLVGVRHLLQRLLELVGHLLGDLLRGRAGPEDAHRHRPEGERRVFVLAELEVGRAEDHQHDQQVARQRRMLERPARDVEAPSWSAGRVAAESTACVRCCLKKAGAADRRCGRARAAPAAGPRFDIELTFSPGVRHGRRR